MALYIVTCEDGVVRHDPFTCKYEARMWAEWGHCCTAKHKLHVKRAEMLRNT